MTTFATIRSALADGLDEINQLRVVDYQTDQVNVYQATIVRGQVTYDNTFRNGSYRALFRVAVYGPRTNERATQVFFDLLCEPSGPASVKAALEADAVGTAAGVQSLGVTTAGEVKAATVGQVDLLVIEFEVEAVI